MIAFLTSSLGGSYRADGKRYPTYLLGLNGLTDQLRKCWKENSRVLIISASPGQFERNDSILNCLKEAFPMSGLSVDIFNMCDYRDETPAQRMNDYDVVLLAGGHVPTQNAYFEKLGLRQLLDNFDGLLISWSAGSMNCAEVVYALPEMPGEGIDKNYKRFINGLGITKHMIIPHFQDDKEDVVDGMRVIEEMAYPDSMGREFIALNDGSFIVIEDEVETLYGEAYLIKDGAITLICNNNEAIQLKS